MEGEGTKLQQLARFSAVFIARQRRVTAYRRVLTSAPTDPVLLQKDDSYQWHQDIAGKQACGRCFLHRNVRVPDWQ